MIISHEHRFIFFKTGKTAGTSVEIALSQHCGESDVITPVLPEDESLRVELGYRGAQNYHVPYKHYAARDWVRLALKQERARPLVNHATAKRVRALVTPEVWRSYYKFCFERNPWDKVLSHYHWMFQGPEKPTLDEYLVSPRATQLKRQGYGVYTIDGEIQVDRVCRYEKLEDELESVRQHLGIRSPLNLPRAKGGARTDRRSYREVLNDAQRQTIADQYAFEISHFNYSF